MKGLLVIFALVAAASAFPPPELDLAKLEVIKEDFLSDKVEHIETPLVPPVLPSTPLVAPFVPSTPLVAPVVPSAPLVAPVAPIVSSILPPTHVIPATPVVDTAVVDRYEGVIPGGVYVEPTLPYRYATNTPFSYEPWFYDSVLKAYPHHNFYGFSERHYKTIPSYYL